jgi:predicted GTPase
MSSPANIRVPIDDHLEEAVQRFIEQHGKRKFTLLTIGRTGVGKSSTINSVMGTVVAEVGDFESRTKAIERKEAIINGIPFVFIDTPGLSEDDRDTTDQAYLEEIGRTVVAIDCLLYVTTLREEPPIVAEDIRAIKLVSRAFTCEVWNRAVLVLTFADQVPENNYRRLVRQKVDAIRARLSQEIGPLAAMSLPSIAVANGKAEAVLRSDGTRWVGEFVGKVVQRVASEAATTFFMGSRRILEDTREAELLVKEFSSSNAMVGRSAFEHPFVDLANSELEAIHKQTRHEALNWFRFSLGAAVVTFLVLTTGVGLTIGGLIKETWVVWLDSIVPGITAALFFAQYRSSNRRLDALATKLRHLHSIGAAMQIVDTILDTRAQDDLRTALIERLTGVSLRVSEHAPKEQ